ncbi:response regulator transcription factor RcsB [Edwardsiella anguillarum]|nr:response regulator transcription factor RcsB [Edwardsiella anguillarum]
MNNLNVIIADDHPIVLFGIRKSLEQIEWVNVVGEFEDSTALINSLPKLDVNVLITDLSMPGDKYGDGITLIKYIKRHFPELSIIVLTMNNNPAILSAVLDLDIEGIVLKQGRPPTCPRRWPPCRKAKVHTGKRLQAAGENQCQRLRRQAPLAERERGFTPVRRGLPGHRDRQKLNRSIKTISSQKKSAMLKLGVDNDIALLNYLSSVNIMPNDDKA